MGGFGYATNENPGTLNDIWKFDGSNWTWISGANQTEQVGNYGIQGVVSPTNIPGSRNNAVFWFDEANDTLWLFGGLGYDYELCT